jgi:hypothetical protein
VGKRYSRQYDRGQQRGRQVSGGQQTGVDRRVDSGVRIADRKEVRDEHMTAD